MIQTLFVSIESGNTKSLGMRNYDIQKSTSHFPRSRCLDIDDELMTPLSLLMVLSVSSSSPPAASIPTQSTPSQLGRCCQHEVGCLGLNLDGAFDLQRLRK